MSSFTSPLVVSPLPDGRNWRLVKLFTYHLGSKYSKKYIRVPASFITDFASSPFFLWSWLPPFGKYTKATVLHDYLYRVKSRTRKQADLIFYEAMLVAGTPTWKARLMYYGVRFFGFPAWHGRSKL